MSPKNHHGTEPRPRRRRKSFDHDEGGIKAVRQEMRATALSETRRSMSADATNDVAGTTTSIDPLAGLLGGERSEHTDTTACGVTQAAGKQGALAGQGVGAVPVLPVPGVGGEKEDGQAFCKEQVPRKVAEPEPEPHQAE